MGMLVRQHVLPSGAFSPWYVSKWARRGMTPQRGITCPHPPPKTLTEWGKMMTNPAVKNPMKILIFVLCCFMGV